MTALGVALDNMSGFAPQIYEACWMLVRNETVTLGCDVGLTGGNRFGRGEMEALPLGYLLVTK